MGLASALAAQSGSQPAYGAPQGHLNPTAGYPQAATGYPSPAGYPPAAGAPQQMPPQQMQQGQWVQPQQPQPQRQGMATVVAAKLQKIVASNQLHTFYPPARLQAVTDRVVERVDFHALAQRWRMPTELAVDLAALALYDIVIYADDSGSMESDNGERIDDLKLIMGKVAEVATLFDDDGIEVRFINSDRQGNGIKNASDASRLLAHLEYRWDTKIAYNMEEKILKPMAYNRQLEKPLLIITITDGEPSDKPQDRIIQTIMEAKTRLSGRYGQGAVAFQFAQVGKDREAQEFLARLDNHPQVGKMIDCTSYYELESAEYAARNITLSVEAWLVKLMVGAIDPEYDEQDEAAGAGQHTMTQQQQYGGGYGAGGYPPQQQQQPYGAEGGYPLQQSGGAGSAYPAFAGGYPVGGSAYPGVQQQASAYPPNQHPLAAAYPQQQQHQQGGHKPKKGFFDKLFS